MKKLGLLAALAALAVLLCGCSAKQTASDLCSVVWEDNEEILFRNQVFTVPRGSDLTVTVSIPQGKRVASVSYSGSTVSACIQETAARRDFQITLPAVRYPTLVRLTLLPDYTTLYRCEGSEPILVTETSERLRCNSLPWQPSFSREGQYPLGWRVDGMEGCIGFGSRFDHSPAQTMALECHWMPCTSAEAFDYTIRDGGAVITGYAGTGSILIPDKLGGFPVVGIAGHAFGAVEAEMLALPHTLQFIQPGAFQSLKAEHVYLFDSLCQISDDSFGESVISHLHIHAATEPVYCGTYFDTLSEKVDYLSQVRESPKIILFCGSSARFGYNSPMLEAAFPGYRVVNMGVYAYSNMLPQAMLLEGYLQEGDIVLSSPELDAIDTQFCGSSRLDSEFFAMMESNYQMLADLNLSGLEGIFDALGEYLQVRQGMTPRSYLDIPAHFDEDNHPSAALSYNRQGDYMLHRPGNTDGKLFGIKRAYYNAAHIREADFQGLNRVYDRFRERGAAVYFTYSPRSERSISADSDSASIAALDQAFREKLHVPVISPIQDSLMDAYYFYGTDNHLTTEGAAIHTNAVIRDLRRALEETP
ncbi:MAG: hypothetical protein PUC00_10115 [Clostridiales bacterium]|nr:hypothetical protein [Clostridiales bacterium]